LQTQYFTKEFNGYEIESKWLLLSQEPLLTILGWLDQLSVGRWQPFYQQAVIGTLPSGVRLFKMTFLFYSQGQNQNITQLAMAAQSPWHKNRYLLAFKSQGQLLCPEIYPSIHHPLIRPESRKGDWISWEGMNSQLATAANDYQLIGTICREKSSVYITNVDSGRNFCLSADYCLRQDGKVLSQVEIEYKGRNGLWVNDPQLSSLEILREFELLHRLINQDTRFQLTATNLTKFEWLLQAKT